MFAIELQNVTETYGYEFVCLYLFDKVYTICVRNTFIDGYVDSCDKIRMEVTTGYVQNKTCFLNEIVYS